MSNAALIKTAIYVRDLLGYDEQLIKIGRQGDNIEDFTTAYIAIDSLGAAQRIAAGEVFDGDAEEMSYQQQYRAPVTLLFYGDGSWERAHQFSALIQSQQSIELQVEQGIAVYRAGQITDIKILTGSQYGERYELALNIQYSISADVDTLRIDEAQIDLISEEGQELTP